MAILAGLRECIGLTRGPLFLLPSAGTGAMEAAVINLFSPGERVLVCDNGYFSGRFAAIGAAFGLHVVSLPLPWDEPADAGAIAAAVTADPAVRGVFVTFHDTATGVRNDMLAIAAALRSSEVLTIVDGVSGVAASPVAMDAWGLDCVVGAAQKALAAPPGVAFIGLSERAWERCQTTTNARFYFDLRQAYAAFASGLSPSPWTPPVATLRALASSLGILLADGLASHYERQDQLAQIARIGAMALGLDLYPRANPSQTVTVLRSPNGIAPSQIVNQMQTAWGITLASGLGPLREATFRIGHAGDIDVLDLVGVLFALEMTLASCGQPVPPGASTGAVRRALEAGAAGGSPPTIDSKEIAEK